MEVETTCMHSNYPSSPQHPLNLFFYSTPSSPRFCSSYDPHHHHPSLSTRNDDDDDDHLDHVSLLSREAFSSVPFSWELTPGIPKSTDEEFDFSGQLDLMVTPSLSSADELFDGGKIRPLRPPPRLLIPLPTSPSKSPTISKSPKQRSKPSFETDDPFEAAFNSSTHNNINGTHQAQVRGRAVKIEMKHGKSRKGISRSLSPLRVSEFALLHQHQQDEEDKSSSTTRGGSRKWRLKDLFLFRSASEGTSGSGSKKYSFLTRRNSVDNDNKGSSFRSSTSGGSVSKRRGQQTEIPVHELHYTAKRAASEGLRKKTSLPYRHSLLGCLGFSPILQRLSNAFPS